MNCRAKTLYLGQLLIAAIVLYSLNLNAESEDLTSYPSLLYKAMSQLPRWSASTDVTERCKLTFSSPMLSPNECEANYNLNFLDSFRSKLFFNFDISDSNQFKKIIFELKPGLKIRGLLALHQSQKKPLVIFRMGVHGNIDEFLAERFLLKLVYEDLGYHILVLESLTSHGYLKLNDRITFGGFEEGLHTFFILNQITNNEFPWASSVTDIHLMGVSLSGAGLFLTAHLDEQFEHKIKSVQAFCPLINFQKTFAYHMQPKLFSVFFDLWNSQRLGILYKKNPDLDKINLWPVLFDFKPRFTPAVLDWINTKSIQPLVNFKDFQTHFPKIKITADMIAHVENSKNLYELNNFWPLFKNRKTPIQIYVTPNDPVVVNFLNTDLIRLGKQPGDFLKTQITELKGVHCALASEYQWPFLVEMVKRGFR